MRVNLTLPADVGASVAYLAAREKRRLSNMVAVLVAEALAARAAKVSP